MRRADIPEAFSLLAAHELVRASDEDDPRDHDKSKRYRVLGLGPIISSENAERTAPTTPTDYSRHL